MRVRSILLGVCTLGLAALLALPVAAQTTQSANVGFVRFVHTAVDVGPIDIYQANDSKPTVANLKYGDVTDFMSLPVTTSGFVARTAGSPAGSQPLFSLIWGIKANESEMITAAGLNARRAFVLEPLTLVRNNTNGKARVRVFDTVWGGSDLSVSTSKGVQISQNQKYLNPSSDMDLAPGATDFQVKDNTGKVVATASGVNLEADKVYVLVLIGGSDGNPPITVLPVVSDEDKTRVQIVNQSSNPVDVYVKGQPQPLAPGLKNGASSDFSTVPSGAVTFVVRAAGSGATSQELASLATQLRPQRDLVVTVSNAGGTLQIAITSETLTAPSASATLMATAQATAAATASPVMPGATSAATATAAG